ncbi:MAG: 5-keto-L-gluconate epimerase [Atribacterota bacterium]|nr:5-keto-L-gluconate epimerase [Atribacterota bacterium]
MKKSIVVSTQKTSFSALAFKEDLEKNIEKVSSLGFNGVELAVRDPKYLDVEKVINMVNESNLEVPAIGTGQAWGEEGLSLSDPNEIVRKAAIDRIIEQIKFASNFNAQVIIGLIRGVIKEGVFREETEEWTIDSLKKCAEFGLEKKIKLTLEPVNRYESNFINTLQEGMAFIDKIGMPNVGLLADTFHMNIEEVSIYKSIIEAKDYITHVHFADSNRWAPGYGHLDFQKIVETLKEINYQGYVSAEILPLPDQDSAAEMTIKTLNSVIK